MNALTSAIADLTRAVAHSSADIKRRFNSAIIVAAGNGTRMGGEMTKQMAELCGMPVIVRTVLQFEACPFINEIVVVAREDELSRYDEFRSVYGFKKLTRVVKGGDTRQKSVMEGLRAIDDRSDFVAIHDGARCLVTPEMIGKVLIEAATHGCATAAERPKDTIKRAGANGYIEETIDRTTIWHAQTPQIFKTDIYRAAAYMALENGTVGTDDNMLAESIGFKVKLVDCGYENLKLTTPDDFFLAEAILRLREMRNSAVTTESKPKEAAPK